MTRIHAPLPKPWPPLPKPWPPLSVALLLTLALIGPFSPGSKVTPATHAAQSQSQSLPVQVGGLAQDVALSGDYAYLGVGHRVLVVDITDQSAPIVVGETPSLPGRVTQVVVEASLVYAGIGFEYGAPSDPSGLAVIDVAIPETPIILSILETESWPSGLDVEGGIAYLTLSVLGLAVIDCRNPIAPVQIGRLDASLGERFPPERSKATDVTVKGDLALLLEVENVPGTFDILRVVDVSNPAEPQALGSYRPDRPPIGVALADDKAYLVEAGGLTVLSVANRLAPQVIGRIEGLPSSGLDSVGNHNYGNTIALEGDRAYFFGASVNTARRLWIADISSPASPQLVGDLLAQDFSVGLAVRAGVIFVANWGGGGDLPYRGLEIHDASDAAAPAALGYIDRDTWHALGVVVNQDWAYVAAAGNGLRVISLDPPSAPRIVGMLDLGGQITDLVHLGDLVYLADASDDASLHVVDVTDPAAPVLITSVAEPAGRAIGIELLADGLVMAFEDGRLVTWSLSNGRAPQLVGSLKLGLHAGDLKLWGDRAFVVAEEGVGFPKSSRLYVVDVSDLGAPQLEMSEMLPESQLLGAPSLAVDATRLYVPSVEDLNLYSWQLGGPSSLLGAGGLSSPGRAVETHQGYAFMALYDGLAVVDISDPTMPRQYRYWPWPSLTDSERATGIDFAGDCALFAHHDAGLLSLCPDLPAPPSATATELSTETPTETATEPSVETSSPTPDQPPSATASPTSSASSEPPSATPSATPSAAASATSPPTLPIPATPTPSTSPPATVPTSIGSRTIFLPIAVRESCPPSDLFADVVLVVDASSSMRALTREGRPKIDLVIDSVRIFLDGLRLEPGRDRAAIIAFNEQARTLQRLSSERLLLDSALASLQVAQSSRVDLGIRQAHAELVMRGRRDQLQSIVLLSDGMANSASAEQVIEAARQVHRAGITIYVVGMGPDMDERVLRSVAADADTYFPAPDPLLIRAIYRDLARRVPCPAGAYWGRR